MSCIRWKALITAWGVIGFSGMVMVSDMKAPRVQAAVALFTGCGFWHRSWGVIAERYPVVRLRGDGFK